MGGLRAIPACPQVFWASGLRLSVFLIRSHPPPRDQPGPNQSYTPALDHHAGRVPSGLPPALDVYVSIVGSACWLSVST